MIRLLIYDSNNNDGVCSTGAKTYIFVFLPCKSNQCEWNSSKQSQTTWKKVGARDKVSVLMSLLWWMDWLARKTRDPVLPRLRWRRWSCINADVSNRPLEIAPLLQKSNLLVSLFSLLHFDLILLLHDAIEHRAVGGAGHVQVCLISLVPQFARLWQCKNQLFLHSSYHSTTHTSFHWHSPAPIAGIMCFINSGAESTPTLLRSAQTYMCFSVCESLWVATTQYYYCC